MSVPVPRRTLQAATLAAAVIGVALAACVPIKTAGPVVAVNDMTVSGVWTGDGRIAAFLGVPFAAPPAGERRWRAPVAYEGTGVIDATRFKPACMQGPYMVDWYRDMVERFGGDPDSFPVPGFSEDCLYLNIWTPNTTPIASRPVMVWIHGGSHRGGWAYEPNYIGDKLARHDVVVVSIAYRLDVFGFFPHPDLAVANFGLLDQIAALAWVRQHIAHFGGDPDNVTVFGESAGASSIGYLLSSPLAEGLFRRAIHQSAGYQLRNDDTRDEFVDRGRALEQKVLAGSNDTGIAALRLAPAEALLDAAPDVYADNQPGVVVDGYTLKSNARDVLDEHHLRGVDLMIGTNADEWRMYLDGDAGESDITARLREYGVHDDAAVRRALATTTDALGRLDRLITAYEFVCPSLQMAQYMTARGKRSYSYYFSRRRPGSGAAALGAYHGAELPYVFDTHDAWLPTAALDRELGATMARYWTQFARTGEPGFAAGPRWPPYAKNTALAMDFGNTVSARPHPELELCQALALSGADQPTDNGRQ